MNLLYFITMSAMVASTSITLDSETITAVVPKSQTTCDGDHACEIDKRSPQFFGAGDPFRVNNVFDFYCIAPYAKERPKIECGTEVLPQPLTHEVCNTICRYDQDAADLWLCQSYSHCSGKELKKQCKCWGYDRAKDEEGAKLIVGKGTPPAPSYAPKPRVAAKNTGI